MRLSIKQAALLGLLIGCLIGMSSPALAQSGGKRSGLPRTDPAYKELIHKAKTEGHVSVIVELKVQPSDADLSVEAAPARLHRQAIAQTQARLLTTAASGATSVRTQEATTYRNVPFLALEADADMLEWLMGSPEVASIQEDRPVPPQAVESISLVGAEAAWARGYSGAGQTVVVIDTGVDTEHESLQGKVVAEACFSTSSFASETLCADGTDTMIGPEAARACDPAVSGCGHGTAVAGIAAGKGAVFSGVARDATILAIQVFSRFDSPSYCGEGKAPCVLSWTSDQLAALDYVYDLAGDPEAGLNIAVVNLSLGGWKYTSESLCDAHNQPMKALVDSLRSVNVAVVAAAGNNGYTDAIVAPACLSNVISVGASSLRDAIWSGSNSASFMDLLAPGQSVTASKASGGYASLSGTSMAAPHVAGAWAVLRSLAPSAGVDEVLSALTHTGMPIADARNGIEKPRLQVDAALLSGALPVELSRFEAMADGATVELLWSTQSELNNAGFEIEQAQITTDGPTSWRPVGFVDGQGTTNASQQYAFSTPTLEPGRYRFRLRQVDFDGTVAYSDEVEVSVDLPNTHHLAAAYPNPFNPRTTFTLTIAQPQQVTVTVYDALGRRVAMLHEGYLQADATHTFTVEAHTWPSGLYLYEAVGEHFRQARPVMLVK